MQFEIMMARQFGTKVGDTALRPCPMARADSSDIGRQWQGLRQGLCKLHQVSKLFYIWLGISFLMGLVISGPAFARPYAPKLACETLKAMIYDKGALVLSTGQFTFDRYVRDQGYCMLGEITEPAWLTSANQAQCFVGYTCGGRQANYN
jgi:hypothetical protein